MTPKILTITAVVGATLVLAVPAAWGNGQPYRDAGDAVSAKLALQSSPLVTRDAGDRPERSPASSSSVSHYRQIATLPATGGSGVNRRTIQSAPLAQSQASPRSPPFPGSSRRGRLRLSRRLRRSGVGSRLHRVR